VISQSAETKEINNISRCPFTVNKETGDTNPSHRLYFNNRGVPTELLFKMFV